MVIISGIIVGIVALTYVVLIAFFVAKVLKAAMSEIDAVDGSSAGIAMCQSAVSIDDIANFRLWHKTEVLGLCRLSPLSSGKQKLRTLTTAFGG